MLSITLIDDVQGWQIELGQGRGDAGGVGIQLCWPFPVDQEGGNVVFPSVLVGEWSFSQAQCQGEKG